MAAVTRSRWVTFDCYGTLADWRSAFASILAPLVGDRVDEVVRAYHQHEREIERERPHRPYREVLVRALALAAADAGVRLGEAEARALPRSWGAVRPFPDAEDLLAALRARGYRLAVLTNCDDDLFELTHRQFRRPFDLFLTAERLRGYKPAPWHFRAFQRVTGVPAGGWVHVACSWYHDIAPARALGVPRVWLDREGTGDDPAAASAHVRDAACALAAVEGLFAGVEPAAACLSA